MQGEGCSLLHGTCILHSMPSIPGSLMTPQIMMISPKGPTFFQNVFQSQCHHDWGPQGCSLVYLSWERLWDTSALLQALSCKSLPALTFNKPMIKFHEAITCSPSETFTVLFFTPLISRRYSTLYRYLKAMFTRALFASNKKSSKRGIYCLNLEITSVGLILKQLGPGVQVRL